jgi:hypothetical protein
LSSKKYSLLTFINGMVKPSASENVATNRRRGMKSRTGMVMFAVPCKLIQANA